MGKRARQAKAEASALVLKNSARSAFLRVCGARVAKGGRVPAVLTFTVEELAQEMGVAVDVMRDVMRECVVPDEVRIHRGSGQLVATFVGHGKIRGLLDVRLAASAAVVPPLPAPVSAPAAVKSAETLIALRVLGAKRVLCNRKESGLEVVCRVQRSENLRAGMELEAAQPGEGGMWFYLGKLPRRPGRW